MGGEIICWSPNGWVTCYNEPILKIRGSFVEEGQEPACDPIPTNAFNVDRDSPVNDGQLPKERKARAEILPAHEVLKQYPLLTPGAREQYSFYLDDRDGNRHVSVGDVFFMATNGSHSCSAARITITEANLRYFQDFKVRWSLPVPKVAGGRE